MKFTSRLLSQRPLAWAVLALAVAGLCYWLFFTGHGGLGVGYETAAVSRGNIELGVASSGTISPLITVPVGSQVSGQLTEIDVDFNSRVKKGQLLAVVDPSTFKSRVQAAEADMAVQQAVIGSNEVQVSNAQVLLDQARRDFERTQKLAEQGLLSTNDLEKARNALEQAQNAVKIAAATLNNSRAQLVKVRSQLDQARIDLSHTEIRAPVDGVVIDRTADVGQTVQSAMTVATLFKIARDLSQVQIETKVDEADIGAVRQAQRATFTVDAYPERNFEGRIAQVRISGSASANVVTYSVMVQADNPEQLLLPGMTANVRLLTAERKGVLRLPASALRFRPANGRARGQAAGGAGAVAGGGLGAGGGAGAGAPGNANGPRALAELTPQLMQQLGLDAQQQAAATAALQSAMARIRAAAQSSTASNPLGGGGLPGMRRVFGDSQDAAAANRQRLVNALANVLTPGQLQQYLAMSSRHAERDATLYVPGADGSPVPRKVRVGLADDNYVELVSGLAEGDRVIVRAQAAGG
jgi:HlyD family secretion protein